MKNFIEAGDIKKYKDPIILDVRTSLLDTSLGINQYKEGHVKGAYYVDLEEDLTGEITSETGNHPLPTLDKFKKLIEKTGARNDSTFIIYDSGDNVASGRLWFLLKYFGLDKALIVNGGFKAILEEGIELVTEDSEIKEGKVALKENKDLLSSYEEVKEYSRDYLENKTFKNNKRLLDSRANDRYRGENETLYDKAGHIPGALSYFFSDNYTDGRVKDLEVLEDRFKSLKDKDLIVSCGSGVTACGNLVVLDELGYKAKLYVGSYSQWLKKGEEVTIEATNEVEE